MTRLPSIVIVVAVIGFGAAVWYADGLTFTGTDPSAKIVTSVLLLIGTFMTAVVSVVGILIKYAIDRQAEARLNAEMLRTHAIQRDAEERLKLEASIRALELLADPTVSSSGTLRRNGVLITLSSLGQHSLAVALLQSILEHGEGNVPAAAEVLDRALRSEEPVLIAKTDKLLGMWAHYFISDTGYDLPSALWDGQVQLPAFARESIPLIVGKVLLARPLSTWLSDYPHALHGLVGRLCQFWQRETEPYVKSDAGAVAFAVVSHIQMTPLITMPDGVVFIDQIEEATASVKSTSVAVADIIARIKVWSTESRLPEDRRPNSR